MRQSASRGSQRRVLLPAFVLPPLLILLLGRISASAAANTGLLLWLPWLLHPMDTPPPAISRQLESLLSYAEVLGHSSTSLAVQIGAIRHRSGNREGALSVWSEADSMPYLLSLGRSYRGQGDLSAADELFLTAKEIWPDVGDAYCEAARTERLAGDSEEALSSYLASVERVLRSDYYIPCHYELSELLSEQGQWCDAAYHLGIASDALDERAYSAPGILAEYGKAIYRCSGSTDQMQEQFRRAAVLGHSDLWLLIDLGEFAVQTGQSQAVVAWADAIAAAHPTSAWPYILQGEHAFRQGDYVDADRYLRRAVSHDESDGIAHYWLGRSYVIAGDFTSALEQAKMAVTLDPQVKWHFLLLGDVYASLGKPEAAADVYRKALDYGHTDPVFTQRLANLGSQ